jgi:hypothetical protein
MSHGDYPDEGFFDRVDEREGKLAKDGAAEGFCYSHANLWALTEKLFQPFKLINESAAEAGDARLVTQRSLNELNIGFRVELNVHA